MVDKEDHFHLGVKALIQDRDGKILLLQKNSKKKLESNQSLWDLPGGRIHRNELLEEALKREVYEETGLKNIAPIKPFTMALSDIRIPLQNTDVGLILTVYLCRILDDHPSIRLSDEHLSHIWILPREAAELLTANHPTELTKKIGQLQSDQSL